ncbi:hypothetical protein LCGC14_2021550, partial [marine sediment metagenome]
MALKNNKLPPPAPTFNRGNAYVSKNPVTRVPGPAVDWKEVLNEVYYPDDYLILDFETYFDDKYSLKKPEWSIIEYIQDQKFEILGMAYWESEQMRGGFARGEQEVTDCLFELQTHYGPKFDDVTVVAHNAMFDMGILAYQFDMYPQYVIDVLGLARHWNPRNKNDLESLVKRFKLKTQKGDTGQFKGWTNRRRWGTLKFKGLLPKPPVQLHKMVYEDWPVLAKYAEDDVKIERELFEILLPKLSNPVMELAAMQHTLKMYTQPCLMVNYDRAGDLKIQMEKEIDRVIK